MRLVDLIKVWADSKGFWSYVGKNYGNVPYINVCKTVPPNARKIVTVWNSGTINFTKPVISHADPSFFSHLEELLSR